jgi:ABC-type multidrug transport system fused ATPase/permease subunit
VRRRAQTLPGEAGTMKFYLRLCRFAGIVTKEIALKVLLSLAITATYITQAIFMGMGLRLVFSQGDWRRWIKVLAVAAGMIALRAFFSWVNAVATRRAACAVKNKIRDLLMNKIIDLGPGYVNVRRSGEIQSLVTDGVEYLEQFLVNFIPQAITVLLTALFISVYVRQMDSVIAAVMIGGILLALVIPQIATMLNMKLISAFWVGYAVLNSQFIDAMQGMTTLKIFNFSGNKGRELAKNAWEFSDESIRQTTISLLSSAVIKGCAFLIYAISVTAGAVRVADGLMPSALLFILLFLVAECVRPITELNQIWHASFYGFSSARQLFKLLDESPKITRQNAQPPGADEEEAEIFFQRTSFSYRDDDTYALRDLSFRIRKGERVAIVGKSGAGKSSIVSLLVRFYDPQHGRILVEGKDIKTLDPDTLRAMIAVVFQETYLFYGSVFDNLRIARPESSREEVIDAAKAANAHDFIMNMPRGYDTTVGERGATLSGGERQRIAIARAILKDSPILVLDEAMSNVDIQSERLIQEALEQYMKKKTCIVIAHRLSTVRNADRILFLDRGRILEAGTHEQLIRLDGSYTAWVRIHEQTTKDSQGSKNV